MGRRLRPVTPTTEQKENEMTIVDFRVAGIPKPAGSKRAFVSKKGKLIVTDDSGQVGKDWRGDVKSAALKAYDGEPVSGPLVLFLEFYFPRPKGHYGSGKNENVIRDLAPKYPTVKPDLTKITRSVEDALTGIVWNDDAMIVIQDLRKYYCDENNPQPGVRVRVGHTADKWVKG
jgi:Holliday junction resolvase RusA-like endonuclease